jgi:hypothetical protein
MNKKYLNEFIEEQNNKGNSVNLLGKSLDVIEEWTNEYSCDIEKLKASKYEGPKIQAPSALIDSF